LEKIYSSGKKVFLSDEEAGLVQNDLNSYFDMRFNLENLEKVEKVFLWNKMQKKVFDSKFPLHRENALNLGSPRLDLMTKHFNRSEKSVEYFREAYGDYLLISSNFTNNNLYGEEKFREKLTSNAVNQDQKLALNQWYDNKKETFFLYLEMIKYLNKKTNGIKIVIRPHPSEDKRIWIAATEGLKNVFVDSSFNLISAIKSAKLVIHHGCTAGFESYLQCIPSIYYDPLADKNLICKPCLEVSKYSNNLKHLENEIIVSIGAVIQPKSEHSRGLHLFHADGKCFKRFVDAFENNITETQKIISRFNLLLFTFDNCVFSPLRTVKFFLRNYLPKFHPFGEIIQEKCPQLKTEDLSSYELNDLVGIKDSDVVAKTLIKNLIMFSKK